ncbi:hypothetical protein HAPAU_39880 [Halalkalicoccus paucihalophilus]|uniref:Uncharacterized protein n=1 Tax=Halalkalicoccus paucihalophilus TaxID=1008153 RepID=A0A151A8G1_9EURY|nr:hypothetical protein HAPAU_39880 [Halalkalicoccus paucihalophilus]
MMGERITLRKIIIAPAVWVSFALLVFPLALSDIDSRLFSPLALPGYVLFVCMTVIGDILPKVRNFGFRLYWVPFIVVCYGVSLALGAGYYALCRRYTIQR